MKTEVVVVVVVPLLAGTYHLPMDISSSDEEVSSEEKRDDQSLLRFAFRVVYKVKGALYQSMQAAIAFDLPCTTIH